MDVGAGRRDEGVGVGGLAGGDEALFRETHGDCGLCVRAFGYRTHLIEFEHGSVRHELADAVENGVDGAVARRTRGADFAVDGEFEVGGLRAIRAGDDFQARQRDAFLLASHLVVDESDDVFIENMLLLVGQILEALEGVVERVLLEDVAQRFQLVAECVAARQLAQHERGRGYAHILGLHDLVGLAVLQHAILVDARLVREGVLADDGLVVLHREASDGRDHLGGA